MSRGRRVPLPTKGYQRAQDADCAYFAQHPNITEYTRPYIPGEAPADMPAGTMVHVKRVGCIRARAFVPPKGVEVRN